jgi:hypothetical protein
MGPGWTERELLVVDMRRQELLAKAIRPRPPTSPPRRRLRFALLQLRLRALFSRAGDRPGKATPARRRRMAVEFWRISR